MGSRERRQSPRVPHSFGEVSGRRCQGPSLDQCLLLLTEPEGPDRTGRAGREVPAAPVRGEQPRRSFWGRPTRRGSEPAHQSLREPSSLGLPGPGPGLTWMMKPVEEHCLTQRLNFRFFLFRSSRSVHVAMNTGSSSIRGSCSTCQERGSREAELGGGSSDLGSILVSAFDQLCDLG